MKGNNLTLCLSCASLHLLFTQKLAFFRFFPLPLSLFTLGMVNINNAKQASNASSNYSSSTSTVQSSVGILNTYVPTSASRPIGSTNYYGPGNSIATGPGGAASTTTTNVAVGTSNTTSSSNAPTNPVAAAPPAAPAAAVVVKPSLPIMPPLSIPLSTVGSIAPVVVTSSNAAAPGAAAPGAAAPGSASTSAAGNVNGV
jgi:hypothetical protein